jgi:general secretion pathway protein K
MHLPFFSKSGPVFDKPQKGVAIITALLIVAIATTISISISTRLQLDVRRTSNMISSDQAYLYSLLAEEFFQTLLKDKDSRKDFIEKPLITDGIIKQVIPVESDTAVLVAVEVTDLSACINVNALISNTNNIQSLDPITERRLQELFRNNGIPAESTQAIADWIDTDLTNSIPDGAEDGYYMNLPRPYRVANTPLQSISELRLIKGFQDKKVLKSTTQLIEGGSTSGSKRFSSAALCAFDTDNNSNIPININTASVEVLKSLQSDITQSQIDDILQTREKDAYTKVPALFKEQANLVTTSSYYLLKTTVKIGNANNVRYSIVFRDGSGKTKVTYSTQRTL